METYRGRIALVPATRLNRRSFLEDDDSNTSDGRTVGTQHCR